MLYGVLESKLTLCHILKNEAYFVVANIKLFLFACPNFNENSASQKSCYILRPFLCGRIKSRNDVEKIL